MILFGEQFDINQLYSFASAQGLTAFLWEYVYQQLLSGKLDADKLPVNLKFRWALASDNIIKRYHQQRTLSFEFAGKMAEYGIRVYGLKGLSLSKYYPRPELRECGDFDCWMDDDFERSNLLAQQFGARYNPYDYRHSVLNYKGLIVENHRYFMVLRGSGRNKRMERYLRDIIHSDKQLDDSKICLPSSQFQAQFTILHMMHHFLYESITVRHLLDWHYFVAAEKDNVDWREFNAKCKEAGVDRFIAAVNHICIKRFGLDIGSTQLKTDGQFADKIWNDTINQNAYRASGVENIWKQRYLKLKNVVSQRWKFNDVYDRDLLSSLAQIFLGMIFDRNVRF